MEFLVICVLGKFSQYLCVHILSETTQLNKGGTPDNNCKITPNSGKF